MTRKQASERAAELWGPTAKVFKHSDPKDRFSRFSIQFIEPGGLTDVPKLHIFGFGDSFDSAFAAASQNPSAVFFAEWWTETKAEFAQFSRDPKEYFRQIMKAKFNFDPKQLEETENNNG
jgi:hypothetical protein